jgi:hypothetical protein
MRELNKMDLQWALRRTPTAVLKLPKDQPGKVFVAGGFLRACVANERVEDIDLFASSKNDAKLYAELLAAHDDKKVFSTDNAYTVKGFALPVQIIHRWTYETAEQIMANFDFTIAMAGFWWAARETDEEVAASAVHHANRPAGWRSICDDRFYEDLAAKRLRYTAPIRNEDAGGSLLRVLKFYQRGYRIPLDSLGAVTTRLLNDVNAFAVVQGREADREEQLAKVVTGLLREVDPNIDSSHLAYLPAEDATTPELTEEDMDGVI